MQATATQRQTDVRPIEPDVTVPSCEDVARLIIEEAHAAGRHCRQVRAYRLLNMLMKAAGHIRYADYADCYHVTPEELADVHDLMDLIMRDDVTVPEPGSAHDAINRLVTYGHELGLVHTRDRSRQPVYCAVAIVLETA